MTGLVRAPINSLAPSTVSRDPGEKFPLLTNHIHWWYSGPQWGRFGFLLALPQDSQSSINLSPAQVNMIWYDHNDNYGENCFELDTDVYFGDSWWCMNKSNPLQSNNFIQEEKDGGAEETRTEEQRKSEFIKIVLKIVYFSNKRTF